MKSVMQHAFGQLPSANIPRSKFNLSHGNKTTFFAGMLVPIMINEVLPGDTHEVSATTFGRLATPLHPTMDNMFIDYHAFFVPNRLVWDNWEKFNGAQDNPGDSTDFQIPGVDTPIGGWQNLSLADYLGVPTQVSGLRINALPFRSLMLIYNEWYRDENLQDSLEVKKDDGPDNDVADTLYNQFLLRGKRPDYFTTCLPWPQKGDAVDLPLGDTAPIIKDEVTDWSSNTPDGFFQNEGQFPTPGDDSAVIMRNTGAAGNFGNVDFASGVTQDTNDAFGLRTERYLVDLSAATAATINSFRLAFQIQMLFEKDARGGTRYTEIIRSHFGVISPDQRLQRPEFLGGGTSQINLNPIAQTGPTLGGTTPQGNLAAMGTTSAKFGFKKSFTEHGHIIVLASMRADLNYQQGLDRMWSRSIREDFYWPALAHLGEQPVYNKEIFAQGTPEDDDVFGYQERYAEYRFKQSQVTGRFRSNDPLSLDTWHISQDFASLPALNSDFIVEQPPIDRIIATPGEPHVIMDMFFNYYATRPMPTYSTPGLVTRL